MALSLFPGVLLVRILKEGGALPWQGLSAVYVLTLLPSYWHTLGSLVAGGMFPAGCFECSTASSDHSPAVFRLQSFSWKVLCLRELFSDFIRRRRCVPESQNAVSICSFGCCCVWVPLWARRVDILWPSNLFRCLFQRVNFSLSPTVTGAWCPNPTLLLFLSVLLIW